MIVLSKVELLRGTKLLFSAVNVSFYDKQKIGVVGKNGSGKTSLFLLLQGILEPTAGDISRSGKLRIVTVEQEIPCSNKSSLEYVIDADVALIKYQHELRTAEKNHDGIKIAELYEVLQNLDGFTAETRAAKILAGLGFSEAEMASRVNVLSGGWRMRLNIARALFIPSEVLLLDEPTNHLDLDAVIWLEKWLKQYPGLLLFISHDREFLDKIADHIVHIENKQLKMYSGNYSSFEKQRIAALAQQQQQYEKQQRQVEHIQEFIRRFKAKATKARQAQSRIKALARMQEIMPAHLDSPFAFEFKEPKYLANPLLSLQKVSFAYSQKNQVLDCVDFQLNTEDRIALLGKNLALQNYAGAVVLVSHDRFLLKQVVDEYWLVADKKVQHFSGNLDAYQDYLLKPNNVKKSPKKAENQHKQLAALEKEIDKLQCQITQLELKIAELSTDPIKNMAELQKMSTKRTALKKQYEEYEDKWLQLLAAQ